MAITLSLINMNLIPSRLELSRILRDPHGKERSLAEHLASVAVQYDLVVIDCPPTECVLTDEAYFASRFLLVPVKPEFLATIGFPLLDRSLQEFRAANRDHKIDVCGIVFNHSSTNISQFGPEQRTAVKEVKRVATTFGWSIFPAEIDYSKSYPRSARESVPIGSTSNVRKPTKLKFASFVKQLFTAIGLEVP